MCGIAGIVTARSLRTDECRRVSAMKDALQHRGPDDAGLFIDPTATCALAQTRLSILDLSVAGHQPMRTTDGRYTIVFNGEIYNFEMLRVELLAEGVEFQSRTDTEVILHLFRKHGCGCVDRLKGMFAFAIWDSVSKSLFAARDPLGIKPLYFWQDGDCFAFASEIRALLKAELGPKILSSKGLAGYLLHGSVQEPETLVENVEMLPAGHFLNWSEGRMKISQYWDIKFTNELVESTQAVKITRAALIDTVRRHFVSDVPVGVFLSGGVDSTALVAIAREVGINQLRTFCIGFEESGFNEGQLAKRTAAHFGTDHHQWTMNAKTARGLLGNFLECIDQPSNDGFNTFCISKLASDSGLKVVLSGVGGDELFGGYPSFSSVPKLVQWSRRLRALGRPIGWLASISQNARLPLRMQRAATFCQGDGGWTSAYWAMRGFFSPTEAVKLIDAYTGRTPEFSVANLLRQPVPHQLTEMDQVSYLELTKYMRNQLLRDSDVMSMAHGLELRVPLVDSTLIEAVGSINSIIRHAPGKRLLLDAIPEVPDWIANQPKRGFAFPFERWVSAEWGDVFQSLDAWSPVRLQKWYRRWALYTLNHFLEKNQIQSAAPIGRS